MLSLTSQPRSLTLSQPCIMLQLPAPPASVPSLHPLPASLTTLLRHTGAPHNSWQIMNTENVIIPIIITIITTVITTINTTLSTMSLILRTMTVIYWRTTIMSTTPATTRPPPW